MMDIVKQRVLQECDTTADEIINVGAIIDQRLDLHLFEQIGEEFRRRFDDVADRVNMILTVEASGIAIAAFTAKYFDYVPVVFARKADPKKIREGYYFTDVSNIGDRTLTAIRIEKKFIGPEHRCLIIDDILAKGEDVLGLAHICKEAGAELLGAGVVIDKEFQKGGQKLRDKGIRFEPLTTVTKIENGVIHFKE